MGGQVGALAKLYFPGGVEIEELNHDQAVEATNLLLKGKNDVTIFEAAMRHEGPFVPVDVLKKVGKTLQVIEVKSKSFDPEKLNPFCAKTALKKGVRELSADLAPYLYDVASQAFVCSKALPQYSISSALMLPNKKSKPTIDGLNHLFLLKDQSNGRPSVLVRSGLKK